MELKIHIISWTHGITEQLKAEYALEWIGRMNNIQVCAMEIVNEESFIHITDKRLRIKALSLCVYKNNSLLTFGPFLNIIVILLIAIYGGCTMDNIILGLLLMCNRTIYQLRDRISKGINLMYSSSMGSIQAAVKKLLKEKPQQHGHGEAQDQLKRRACGHISDVAFCHNSTSFPCYLKIERE